MNIRLPSIVTAGVGAVFLAGGLWWFGWARSQPSEAILSAPNPENAGDRDQPTRPDVLTANSGDRTTLDQIHQLLATLDPVLPGELENKPAIELLLWWAEIDPANAIKYAASHASLHGRITLPAELFALWLKDAENAALTWALGQPPGDLRSQLMPEVVVIMAASGSPREALQMTLGLQGHDRHRALSALFSKWAMVDPISAAALAESLPTMEEQSFAMRYVAQKWAEHDLASAVEWVKSLPPPPSQGSSDVDFGVMEAIVIPWAVQAPSEAAQHLLATPERTRRIQMLGMVAECWANRDPQEALNWASMIADDADRNVLVRGVLVKVAEMKSLAAAADLVIKLPDAASQRESAEFILGKWIATNPVECANWATSHATTSSPETLSTLVSSWGRVDLLSASAWLNTLPPGNARDISCAAFARHLAPSQPQAANVWADTIANPKLRQQERDNIQSIQLNTR